MLTMAVRHPRPEIRFHDKQSPMKPAEFHDWLRNFSMRLETIEELSSIRSRIQQFNTDLASGRVSREHVVEIEIVFDTCECFAQYIEKHPPAGAEGQHMLQHAVFEFCSSNGLRVGQFAIINWRALWKEFRNNKSRLQALLHEFTYTEILKKLANHEF